jgi:hypothetical protein
MLVPWSAPRHRLPGQSSTRSHVQLHLFISSSLHDIPYLFLLCPLLWLMPVRSICLPLWSTLTAPAVLVGFRPVAEFGSVRLQGQYGIRIAHNGGTRCGVHRCYASRSTTRSRAGLHNERRISSRAARSREWAEWHAHYCSVSSFHHIPALLPPFSVP